VFQDYYSKLPEFEGNSKISLIGTIAQALSYLGAPLSVAVAKQYPKYQRHQVWTGWILCILGLLAGSFTSTIDGLIATQGLMYGVGFVILIFPIISMVNEWWIARKGMAFGLVSSASGATGTVMPFIIEAMLKKYGYKTTLRASAIALAILTGPFLPLLRGRLPPSEQTAIAKTNWSFLKKPLFWIYCSSALLQGFGISLPALYLPSYATALGLQSTQGALLLALLAIFQVLGQFTFGYLSDKRISVSTLATICSTVATIAALALWGTAKSLILLLVFSIIYGFFGYGFGSMRVGMGKAVGDDPPAAFATYTILVFLQGIGNVSVGPISAALLSPRITLDDYGISRYGFLVIFTGASLFASALIISSWHTIRFCMRSYQTLAWTRSF
jgi:MFS family permease